MVRLVRKESPRTPTPARAGPVYRLDGSEWPVEYYESISTKNSPELPETTAAASELAKLVELLEKNV